MKDGASPSLELHCSIQGDEGTTQEEQQHPKVPAYLELHYADLLLPNLQVLGRQFDDQTLSLPRRRLLLGPMNQGLPWGWVIDDWGMLNLNPSSPLVVER